MIDMRKRFRGNKPIAAVPGVNDGEDTKYIGGVGDGMLYASIGRKDLGLAKAGEVGYGAGEDENRGKEELVPARFRDDGGADGTGTYYSGYSPPSDFAPKSEDSADKRGKTEREGAGWSWWRGG
jgi:hypothetical protein